MDILFRLIKDGKVVGYERHEYHADIICIVHTKRIDGSPLFSNRINHSRAIGYIKHDRKDLWTGIEVDGVKVFERDEVENVTYKEPIACRTETKIIGVVRSRSGRFYPDWKLPKGFRTYPPLDSKRTKIIGTEGVE